MLMLMLMLMLVLMPMLMLMLMPALESAIDPCTPLVKKRRP